MRRVSDISVVIPNWNGQELLKVCLSSLKKQTIKNFEVIVVDNGSVDGSVEYTEKAFPEFKIIKLDKNYGFAKAVNEGIKKSLGKYVVLLNNDTEVDKDFLKFMVKAAEDRGEIGFITAKRLNFYKRDLIDSVGDDIDSVGHLIIRGLDKKDSKKFKKGGYIFLASGGSCLIKREVFKKIGFFDEDYFMYMEDADFFMRAQLAGFRGWFESKAIVYHMKMASSKDLSLVEYWNFRNMMMTVIKDFPRGLLLDNFNWLKIILVNLNTLRYFFSQGMFINALKAEVYILRNFNTLLKKRKFVQGIKVVDDQYISENVLNKNLFTK